jgi:hypothetical protein
MSDAEETSLHIAAICCYFILTYIRYELVAKEGRFDSSYKYVQKMAAAKCTARYTQFLIYAWVIYLIFV